MNEPIYPPLWSEVNARVVAWKRDPLNARVELRWGYSGMAVIGEHMPRRMRNKVHVALLDPWILAQELQKFANEIERAQQWLEDFKRPFLEARDNGVPYIQN